MNTPEHLPHAEMLHELATEKQADVPRLAQAQADRIVLARVESLRTLIGKVSPARYESLVTKIEREREMLQRFVDRKERVQAAELQKAQDLDDRYFVKKRLTHSII